MNENDINLGPINQDDPNGELLYIELRNRSTNTTVTQIPVYSTNTLRQIVDTYGADIGLNMNAPKFIVSNKRTNSDTCDLTMTCAELDVENGDVLLFNDDGFNA